MQRRMMRQIEVEPHYQARSKREKDRIATLKKKGYLRDQPGGGLRLAGLAEPLTCFVQEGKTGPVKICRTTFTQGKLKAVLVVLAKLQAGNHRNLRLLGYYEDDRLDVLQDALAPHHLGHGWFEPHSDVLQTTKKQGFERTY